MNAYYAPPGGDMTAAAARALMGLGIAPAGVRYVRTIPTAVVMRAAQAAAALRASQNYTMTGMGILPSVNVRYAKTAIPAALASRRWREMHPETQTMSGLGKAGARAIMPKIIRQAGFFMGPGGGPGGGPFSFPGFTMSGMGLSDDPTMFDPGSVLTPPPDYVPPAPLVLLPQPSDFPQTPTTYDPTAALTPPTPTLPQFTQTSIPFFQPTPPGGRAPAPTLLPMTAAAPGSPVPGAAASPFSSASLSSAIPYALAAVAGVVVLRSLRKKGRR